MYSHLKNKHAEIYSGSNTKQNLINMKISIFSKYRVHTRLPICPTNCHQYTI